MLIEPKFAKQKNILKLSGKAAGIHAIRNESATGLYALYRKDIEALEKMRNDYVAEGRAEGPYFVDIRYLHVWALGTDLYKLVELTASLLAKSPDVKLLTKKFTVAFSYEAPIIVLLRGTTQDHVKKMQEYIHGRFSDVNLSGVTTGEIVLTGSFLED